jgi:hypothetical protein
MKIYPKYHPELRTLKQLQRECLEKQDTKVGNWTLYYSVGIYELCNKKALSKRRLYSLT